MKTTHGGKREGAGRKPTYSQPVDKITLKIPRILRRAVDKHATKTKRSRNALIVEAVAEKYA